MTASNRRDFLRALGLRAARDAKSAAEVAVPLMSAASPTGIVRAAAATQQERVAAVTVEVDEAPRPAPLAEPAAPTRCATAAELDAIIATTGLAARRDEISALARRSVRLVPGAATDSADAWVDLVAARSLADTDATVMLAQIAGNAPELAGTVLATSRWWAMFFEPGTAGVQAIALDQPAALGAGIEPVALAAHLALPRVWTDAVRALDLTAAEHDAYVVVRDRLAEAQGLEAEPGAARGKAYHRLFGYPDETTGSMPDACVTGSGAGDWRLLLQVTVAPTKRLYVWCAGDDLQRLATFVR